MPKIKNFSINKNTLQISFEDGTSGSISLEKFLKNSEILKANIDKKTGNFLVNDTELCKDAIYRQVYMKSMLNKLKIDPDKL